ncbi:carboxypeptidase-like regulatory domain-containing protein [Paradesertivirga mongoliensis]|uniref:Carboxypeptidase-like regulatory domain-containing protein n=2 Tax=Paradesertivirga mongoliensis TaxID=2100740 RepID=A0ABW4ZKV8_9SPHI
MYFLSAKPLIRSIFLRVFSCFVLTCFVNILSAQTGSISGKLSKAGDIPLSQTHVFLANTTLSTQTDEKGFYSLKNIPEGNYILSAFVWGSELYQQNIMVRSGSINADISLKPITALTASKAGENEKKSVEQFLKTFGKRRKDVKLLNPAALRVTTKGTLLEASSDDILNLQNDYLGYETKLLLEKYVEELSVNEDQPNNGLDGYEGIISYAELKGSSTDQKRWQTNRLKAYQGSALHFYRSLIANDLKKQGFSIYPLVSKLNSKRESDSLINSKILLFENPASGKNRNDSLKFWRGQREIPKYNHVLYPDSVKTSELITRDSAGLYVLKYPYKLYVKYIHPDNEMTAMSNNALLDFHRSVSELSIAVELRDHSLVIDQNGNVLEPERVKYEGGWSPKIAEMLPLNYNPEDSR